MEGSDRNVCGQCIRRGTEHFESLAMPQIERDSAVAMTAQYEYEGLYVEELSW